MAAMCYVCGCALPSSSRSRRSLDSKAEQNKSVVAFLEKYVTVVPISTGVRRYVCKPCFAQADRARRDVEHAEAVINSLRAKCPDSSPVMLIAAEKSSTRPSTSTQRSVTELHTQVETQVETSGRDDDPGTPTRPKPKRRRVSLVTAMVQENSPVMKVTVAKAGQKRPVRKFRVAKRFQQFVESTRYKNSPYTARTAFRAPSLRRAMLRQMSKCIRRECQALCSKKGTRSVLRRSSVEDVKKFKWAGVSRELHHRAPTLFLALKAACIQQRKKKGTTRKVLSMAAAVLLRGRNQFLNLPQTVISTILYTGHCSKMVQTTVL
jgi:hypothetical protein